MNEEQKPIYLEDKLREINDSGRLSYRSSALPTWCPGCGYFAITEAVAKAFTNLDIVDDDTVVVSGIGCASRFPFFLNSYGFHTVHGRALPVATGIKVANENLNVLVVGGDGDGFAIGGAHLSHTARRNIDITYILFDNGIYGLTKGQTSPTSVYGFTTKSTPYENQDTPLNPLMMMLSYGSSWVAQTYAGQPHHLAAMVEQALSHRGFSYLHVISPCVTFDKTTRTYQNVNAVVRDVPADHDTGDRMAAMQLAENEDAPALGIFYSQQKPTLNDGLNQIIELASGRKAAQKDAS